MVDQRPEEFYTGLIAELYAALRSTSFDPEHYARLIADYGQSALELGCGDGDPLLELRRRGIDVDGIDSSADMIFRLHDRAAEHGLDVTACAATMQDMDPGRVYRTVFLAGPTFNLLPDDEAMAQALTAIAGSLDTDGAAIIPLFIPAAVEPATLPRSKRQETETGWIRCTTLEAQRDEMARTQRLILRYERDVDEHQVLERPWLIHWVELDQFASLAQAAGLQLRHAPSEIGPEPADVVLVRR